MDRENLHLLHVYLRAQAERSGMIKQKLDWFFEQSPDRANLVDDGVHPLLAESCDPHAYSGEVWSQALTTWALLDNKNPVKFVCDYFHTLEKLGENSPLHVRDYVKRSLVGPSTFAETPEQMFSNSQARRISHSSSSGYHGIQNRQGPCFYKHQCTDSNYVRTQSELTRSFNEDRLGCHSNQADYNVNVTAISVRPNSSEGLRENHGSVYQNMSANHEVHGALQGTNGFNRQYQKILPDGLQGEGMVGANMAASALQMFAPSQRGSDPNEIPSIEQEASEVVSKTEKEKFITQSQTSVESTPSKASEADSCYQSLCSPFTDHED